MSVCLLALCMLINWPIDMHPIEKWSLDYYLGGMYFNALIDHDGALVAYFDKDQAFVANIKQWKELRPQGNGPSDLFSAHAMALTREHLVVFDSNSRVKYFKKSNDGYAFDNRTYFLTPGKSFAAVSDMVLTDNALFVCGAALGPTGFGSITYVRSFDLQGEYIADLVSENFGKDIAEQIQLKRYFLKRVGTRVLYLKEDELDAWVFDSTTTKDPKAVTRVPLEKPEFYRKRPENFYFFTKDTNLDKFHIDVQKWRTGYTAISNVATLDVYLVVQVRTNSTRFRKFGLLFYDNQTLKLQHVRYTDHFLITARANKLYLHQGGEPGMDPEADQMIIHVLQVNN